jgi:hypothetical protein
MKHQDITGRIIQCVYKVHNTLGFGFLENVYQNALLIELGKNGLEVGLLINFGERAEIKRKVLTPPPKDSRSQEIDCPIS